MLGLTVDKSVILVGGDVQRGGSLAEEGNNGLARVTTHNGDLGLGGVLLARVFLDEGLSADNVEGGHTEEALRVKDASGFEHLSGNRDGRVDGVGDDQNESLGGELGNALDEIADNAGVNLEQVITGHARFA